MWNCKETGKQVHFDLLARAHLCPRHSSEFPKKIKIKIKGRSSFVDDQKERKKKKKIEESQRVWDQIKEKWERKRAK
jgi:hypothetical protein